MAWWEKQVSFKILKDQNLNLGEVFSPQCINLRMGLDK